MVPKIPGTIILFLLSSLFAAAQTPEEIAELMRINQPQAVEAPSWEGEARNNTSEYDALFSGLFLVYKNFFSSQDVSKCSFTPSCSVYAIQAIKKQGPVVGLVNFFDRFTRCNGLSPHAYPIDEETQLLYDPVH